MPMERVEVPEDFLLTPQTLVEAVEAMREALAPPAPAVEVGPLRSLL
jgi:hypothetical protein